MSRDAEERLPQHTKGFADKKTCIDCHKGVAHSLPPIEQRVGSPRVAQAD